MENKAPSKAFLMEMKDSLEFAKIGRELLDQKRMILVGELLSMLDSATDLDSKVENYVKEANLSLQNVLRATGSYVTTSVALGTKSAAEINISKKRLLGVDLPEVKTSFVDLGQTFSSDGTSCELEVTKQKYEKLVRSIGEFCSLVISCNLLSASIKKTVRKINSLEKVTIPQNKKIIAEIEEKLEEAEREDFLRIRSFKKNRL